MKEKKGSALVEYAIPTAIVGIVLGMGIYYMSAEGYLTKFISASSNMEIDSSTGVGKIGPKSSPSGTPTPTLGSGTPASPVSSCTAGTCTIDFGDFKLSNIPEDFGTYVETNGSSGGTDKMMEMLEQLAISMDDPKTPTDEGADFRDMANLGHFIARNDEYFESNLDSTNINNDAYLGILTKGALPTIPAYVSTLLPGYISSGSSYYNINSTGGFYNVVDSYNNAKTVFDTFKDSKPMYAFYEKYKKIMDNGTYPDSVKNLTQQVFLQVDDLTYNMTANAGFLAIPTMSASVYHKDPFTGAVLEEIKYDSGNRSVTLDNILHPESSKFTDFHSAVVCTAGKDVDAGKECHKK